MRAMSTNNRTTATVPSARVLAWRTECLITAGFPAQLARSIAAEGAYDLHAVLSLVDRGCRPELAARILAPLDHIEPRC
jgi:hypothetical protein